MLHLPALGSLQALADDDLAALVDRARLLQRDAFQAAPLRGRILALLSDDHDSAGAHAFLRAATGLGARVAQVRATGAGPRDLRDRAGLLGRLYDAIECQGLAEPELQRLVRAAGVPVFNGIALPTHPLQQLAEWMTRQELQRPAALPAQALARNHHHLLQAVLSRALA